MDNVEKDRGQPIVQELVQFDGPPIGVESEPTTNLIKPILRRWRIVIGVFLLVCAVGIPGVWLTVKPAYEAIAAIRVAPVIPSILFGDSDSDRVMPMYNNFKNTQADLIKSDNVLQRVADELIGKNPAFFEKPGSAVSTLKDKLMGNQPVEAVAVLRAMVRNESLSVIPEQRTELIKISMKAGNPNKAVQIVNSFVNAYMAIEGSTEAQKDDRRLTLLEDERKVLADKVQRQRQTVYQMAEEYGSMVLTDRQQIMLERIASLQAELTAIQTRKITLETQRQLLEKTDQKGIAPETLLKMRYEFINADFTIQALSNNVMQLEQGLIVARQTLAPTNPELKRKAELLEALKTRLEERRQELGQTFDGLMTAELTRSRRERLTNVRTELQQIANYEKRLQNVLAKENAETIELGRKHLAIQDQQEQLNLTKELYDTVRRSIQELEMERKRPARISVAYYANVVPVQTKRVKLTAAMVFGAMALAAFLAFLRDKADMSLYTLDDVVHRVGVRVIGTTTSAEDFDKPLFEQQLENDYQTIRANMGLLEGEKASRIIVVTSPGIGDGKTTFALNLATSFAQSGEKVLLVDGDLRKPNIARMLNLPADLGGLRAVFFGEEIDKTAHPANTKGLYVLVSYSRDAVDMLNLLVQPHSGERLRRVSAGFDRVIIDTSPVLAFSDALLWSKMADAVILTSFAKHTSSPDLREAIDRLKEIGVDVLGTVLHNVRVSQSYHRYGYKYYGSRKRSAGKDGLKGRLLLGPEREQGDSEEGLDT